MKALALAVAALLPAQDLAAQGARQAPASQPKLERKRDGGFHGIWFAETRLAGEPALAIRAVLKGSDAERLGFRAGDHIVAVDGERFRDGDHFIQQLYMTVPSIRARLARGRDLPEAPATHRVTVVRGGEEVDIEGGLLDLDASPKVGDRAPDFTLADPTGARRVTLSKLCGKRPVVLVFGSYT